MRPTKLTVQKRSQDTKIYLSVKHPKRGAQQSCEPVETRQYPLTIY